jgi:hypothetical protein
MIFSENNKIFRVFQKQDFDMYGKSLGISEIKTLNEDQYKEYSILFELYFFALCIRFCFKKINHGC